MNETVFSALFAVLAGLFAIFCAWKDYDWFMEHRKARFFVAIFGRDGARIFYGILGLLMMGMGAYIAMP